MIRLMPVSPRFVTEARHGSLGGHTSVKDGLTLAWINKQIEKLNQNVLNQALVQCAGFVTANFEVEFERPVLTKESHADAILSSHINKSH